MRYEITGSEWSIVRRILLAKRCGAYRPDDRRVLNGIQEVVGSISIGSTNFFNDLVGQPALGRFQFVTWEAPGKHIEPLTPGSGPND